MGKGWRVAVAVAFFLFFCFFFLSLWKAVEMWKEPASRRVKEYRVSEGASMMNPSGRRLATNKSLKLSKLNGRLSSEAEAGN
jgi:hypothetical protein